MNASAFRKIFRNSCPLLIGDNYERVAPVHVINGFLSSQFGSGDNVSELRELLVSNKDEVWDKVQNGNYDFIQKGLISNDRNEFKKFQDDFKVLLNPDRRTWVNFGSLFPVHGGLVNNDPSDDNFGRYIWEMLQENAPDDFWDSLRRLFSPHKGEIRDPVTASALIMSGLNKEDGLGLTANSFDTPQNTDLWYASESENTLSKRLTDFLINLIPEYSGGENQRRLSTIRNFARGLYLAVILAILHGPVVKMDKNSSDSSIGNSNKVPLLLCFGGLPPGSPSSQNVTTSSRSVQRIIRKHRSALINLLVQKLEKVELPDNLPANQKRKTAIRLLITEIGNGKKEDAEKLLNDLKKQDINLRDGEVADEQFAHSVLDTVLPENLVMKGLKSMGNKIGFLAPSRGRGRPRFVLETPLLATIVKGLAPKDGEDSYDGLAFEEFVDLAREKLGIVLGVGSKDRLGEKLPFTESGGQSRQMLLNNQDLLRKRLIRAGLATEYSDGNTEVHYDW